MEEEVMNSRGTGGSDKNIILMYENLKRVKMKKRHAAVESTTRRAET